MSKIIVITSGKGGVGKTTSAANIGMGLALEQKKTLLIDTDTGLRNLDLILGLENMICYTLVDVVKGKANWQNALIKHPQCASLFLLPTSQKYDKSVLTGDDLKKLCLEMSSSFDYIIIDCPAGIEQGFQTAIAAADIAIVVTMPEMAALRDADKIIGELNRCNLEDIKLIINRIRPAMVQNGDMLSIEDVKEILGVDVLGEIPDEETVIKCTNQGETIISKKNTQAGQAFHNITQRLLGQKVPFLDLHLQPTLLQKLKHLFH